MPERKKEDKDKKDDDENDAPADPVEPGLKIKGTSGDDTFGEGAESGLGLGLEPDPSGSPASQTSSGTARASWANGRVPNPTNAGTR